MDYLQKYNLWVNSNLVDENTKKELKSIKNLEEIQDRFYKDLEFGTGGLRGIIGSGSNRMNIYTVGKATQGLAKYLTNKYSNGDVSVTIAYDSRIMSKEFAETAAKVLCANNIKVNLFESLRPTPMLSYAVRYFKSKAGIVITASHNPKEYNGYKVYGEDGGQVTDKAAKEILSFIQQVTDFSDMKIIEFEEALKSGYLKIIGEELDKSYIDKVKDLSIRKDIIENSAKDLNIIYTPLHGSGNIPVRRVLKELGYSNLKVVKEQELPDGNFPTTSYPNPENPEVFEIALNMAKEIKPDIIFGTDPDCDRIGVVVKNKLGEFKVLTGNQVGVLLTEYILSSLKEKDMLPSNGVVVKTIVTTDITKNITGNYGIELINVLTGFKYIGEKIKEFKESGKKKYIFGFEESYGYLAGDFVRDKDAVIASMLICEMALYYKNKGLNLYDALINLYEKYGFTDEKLFSIELKGKEGREKIEDILDYLRHSMSSNLAGVRIIKKIDYKTGIEKDLLNIQENNIDLPKSNVLKFILEDNSWFVVRPSGTEPKLKIYLSVTADNEVNVKEIMDKFMRNVKEVINSAYNC